MTTIKDISRSPALLCAVAFGLSAAAIGSALLLEHVWGYLPCKLCLEQRAPYYHGLFTLVLATGFSGSGRHRWHALAFACLSAALFAKGAWLGASHAGVEWGFWEGPGDCGATLSAAKYEAKDLLEAIRNTRPVSCTEAALRVLGLSLAGWNVVVSVAVAGLSARAAWVLASYRNKDSNRHS